MKKYVQPTYEMEGVETEDIILASSGIQSAGTDKLGSIEGNKGVFQTDFDFIFGEY